MRTWDDYKSHIKKEDPKGAEYVGEAEAVAEIISAVIRQRNALGMSQRDLAALCEMPQSSVARIEAMRITPNLETMLRIMKPLGLKLEVTAIK